MWYRNIFRAKHPAEPENGSSPAIPPEAYRQLDRLQIHASRYLRGASLGKRPSQQRRPAADFREHRKYVPGDDVRFVDWKASARSEHIYLKQGELPQETTIHLLIDTSASMAWGSPPKKTAVLQLAAALGYLALANDDRLQLAPLSAGELPVKRIKGKANFPSLINSLRNLVFEGQVPFKKALRRFSRAHRGGVVLILSDLLDVVDLAEALAGLPRPTWDVSVLHTLHPHELSPDILGEFEMVDAENGARANYDIDAEALENYQRLFESWRHSAEMACIENNALYTLLSTGWSLQSEILPLLRKLHILEPV